MKVFPRFSQTKMVLYGDCLIQVFVYICSLPCEEWSWTLAWWTETILSGDIFNCTKLNLPVHGGFSSDSSQPDMLDYNCFNQFRSLLTSEWVDISPLLDTAPLHTGWNGTELKKGKKREMHVIEESKWLSIFSSIYLVANLSFRFKFERKY